MRRALISVLNKTNIVEFSKALEELGFEIISTGQTKKTLTDSGLHPIYIEDITGFPECLDGRLKTLHPAIHGGLLAKRNDENHMRQIGELNISPIDLLCVNLYDFKGTILKESVKLEEAIENIDIGGPAMLRSAAKNYKDVVVICDPDDYAPIILEMRETGCISEKTRLYLAAKVFSYTAAYDALVSAYLNELTGSNTNFPQTLTLTYEKVEDMRYGENPHQEAAFYREIKNSSGRLTDYKQLHGMKLSFNNINDLQGALALLKEFDEAAVVACKHSNPCGVGLGVDVCEAYLKAHKSDPESIYGGIITTNREIDENAALEMSKTFLEIIAAPSFSEAALEIFTKKKNIRLLSIENIGRKEDDSALDIKKVSGGVLVQRIDNVLLPDATLQFPTLKKPSDDEMKNLLFAWKLVKHVKSNGIAIAKDGSSAGLGIGQVRRSWACEQAIAHGIEILGEDFVSGAALASDGFFPFPDCVELAAKAGIKAIIQPGGSKGDNASIEACDRLGIAMVFTGMRHFRH